METTCKKKMADSENRKNYFQLPQFLRDFNDYAIMLIKILNHFLTVRNFFECTINKKLHDLLVQFVNNRYLRF